MTTHRPQLPTVADARAAVETAQAETGRIPSVLAVARRLGIANTTFRRNYPQLCEELAAVARRPSVPDAAADAYTGLVTDNARLRRVNRDLREQLDLAIAAIQRLSIDNARLLAETHAQARVTRLPRNP